MSGGEVFQAHAAQSPGLRHATLTDDRHLLTQCTLIQSDRDGGAQKGRDVEVDLRANDGPMHSKQGGDKFGFDQKFDRERSLVKRKEIAQAIAGATMSRVKVPDNHARGKVLDGVRTRTTKGTFPANGAREGSSSMEPEPPSSAPRIKDDFEIRNSDTGLNFLTKELKSALNPRNKQAKGDTQLPPNQPPTHPVRKNNFVWSGGFGQGKGYPPLDVFQLDHIFMIKINSPRGPINKELSTINATPKTSLSKRNLNYHAVPVPLSVLAVVTEPGQVVAERKAGLAGDVRSPE